jgi:hypothetical protein
MKHLTPIQKQFLLDVFFVNEKYAGWRNIATHLLEMSKCIVAGTENIWNGGIGNFIKVSPAKDAIECSLYEFDLNEFLSSELYKHTKESYIEDLTKEKDAIEKKWSHINNL